MTMMGFMVVALIGLALRTTAPQCRTCLRWGPAHAIRIEGGQKAGQWALGAVRWCVKYDTIAGP